MYRKESPQLRSQVCNLAPSNWAGALAIADQIIDPWYACQAYAWCGRFAPASASRAMIAESFRQASAGKDAYQQFAATAWPLRALIEVDRADDAVIAFNTAANIAAEVEPSSSRAEACFVVFQAVAVGPQEFSARAFEWLLTVLKPYEHWRTHRAVRDAVIQAVNLGLVRSEGLHTLIENERLASKIAARLKRGDNRQPRPFFWSGSQSVGA